MKWICNIFKFLANEQKNDSIIIVFSIISIGFGKMISLNIASLKCSSICFCVCVVHVPPVQMNETHAIRSINGITLYIVSKILPAIFLTFCVRMMRRRRNIEIRSKNKSIECLMQSVEPARRFSIIIWVSNSTKPDITTSPMYKWAWNEHEWTQTKEISKSCGRSRCKEICELTHLVDHLWLNE